MIMVSAPAPIREYGYFLDSLSVGAIDFICHPYRASDIQIILWSAIQAYCESAHSRSPQSNQSENYSEVLGLREFWLRRSA
jgi:FixJ family two-component response regulator